MTPRPTLAVLVALALVAVAAGCSDDGPGATEGRLEVDGVATVTPPDGEAREVRGTTEVELGDHIAVETGTAILEAGFGPVFELRDGLADADPTAITFAEVTELEAGDLLVVADDPVTVQAAGTDVTVDDGAVQVSRFLGMGVRAYAGDTVVDSAGQVRRLEALRTIEVGVLGSPPSQTPPIRYVGADPWDRRYLGEAIAYGEELQRKAIGLIQNLSATVTVDASFLRRILPALAREPAFGDDLIDESRDPAELIVGAAIAALGVRGDFVDRWTAVFAFRDEGAAWGLVALDQKVSQQPAIAALEGAIASEQLAFAEPPPTTTTPTTAPSDDGPAPTTTTTPPPTTGTTTPPTSPPPTEPDEPPPLADLEPVADPLDDLLDDLVESLLGG